MTTKTEARNQSRLIKLRQNKVQEGIMYIQLLRMDNEVGYEFLNEEERKSIWKKLKKLLKLS
jgi:hypothetical protein